MTFTLAVRFFVDKAIGLSHNCSVFPSHAESAVS